ncbi:hypothetical protein GUJ93_ZPchr0003g18264 [Zizania palustris]|uniref:Uncharacterized protein n=1 Tax=Zizania palustris TaxID=103762 RepID=A0A8J5SUJ3_ZIZPA|nr:hypothetical protein GUJ93_ZPchr0003g18264 [Zizania palustris]
MSLWLHYSEHGRRAPRSWTARLLSSVSLPPGRLLAFFGIVLFFLAVSSYVDYRAIERRAEIGARVFAAPLAAVTVFLLFVAVQHRRRRSYWAARHALAAVQVQVQEAGGGGGSPPWVVLLLVALLLLMLSFQSSVHSMWFRPLWGSDY